MSPAVSLLLLTEDGSAGAFTTLRALTTKMLRLVDRATATHRVHIEPSLETKPAMVANRWRSKKAKDERLLRDLRRTLATKVLEDGVPGYVLLHFDGDRPWHGREDADNVRAFGDLRRRVRPIIEDALRRRGLPSDDAAIDERLRRICPITPYYSIEAWLFQNTARARDLCQRGCGKHLEIIDEWERDRALLDEIAKPKEQLCFKGRKNHELAESFTAALANEVHEVGKSFFETVERLRDCPGLREALRATWEPPST